MNTKRWGIALAGVLLQVALGAVYAWSVFRKPLATQFHWTIAQVTLTFTISIMVLGFAAFFGGLWNDRSGPRVVAVTGGFLYGLGSILASFTDGRLWWLYLTYGVIGGIGLGFAYIIPVSVLLKWFPDKRGLMTGIAVGGFGAGALITAPVATHLIQTVGVTRTFFYLGIAYLIVAVLTGFCMQNPPTGWKPEGWTPAAVTSKSQAPHDFTLAEALKSWQWWALWLLLFLNTSAGISIISQEAPIFQELTRVTAIVAAEMVGIVSIGNALGRVAWSAASDYLTRRFTFLIMFLLQAVLFWLLPSIRSTAPLTFVVFIILMCYGGGFGTMPAFTADYFGAKYVGPIYGLLLTAWGFASAFGPLLVAHLRQTSDSYTSGLHALSVIMLVSAVLPFIVRPPKPSAAPTTSAR
ncbi:MAG: OFA family MFS transporter [Acidobacteriaceae bacterium]|nr:OFA family MFS transporter [Acidobacteriaceae bacterium]